VQNDAELILKCITETDKIETATGLLTEAWVFKRRRARHVPLNARVIPLYRLLNKSYSLLESGKHRVKLVG